MFKKLWIVTVGILTLIAIGISYVANTSYAERRDRHYEAASGITEACSALRDESFRYEEAKRNALAAYDAELSHLRSAGKSRNRNFRRLLAGSSTGSFTRAAGEFARALEECENVLQNELAGSVKQRTSPDRVRKAARNLAKMLLEGSPTDLPGDEEMRTLERLEVVDKELVGRSAKALPAAAAARDKAAREALRLSARIAQLGSLALLLQLLATGVVLAKDLAD